MNSYDLESSQVATPGTIVKFFWQLVASHRSHVGSVLDMGAGDGRLAFYGKYVSYHGVEIDRNLDWRLPWREGATISKGCAFASMTEEFDVCIGNPPYLRHQDIESSWKYETLARLGAALGSDLHAHCNLFVYFIALGLIRTVPDGLVAMIIPFDWITRPSALPLRQLIEKRGWTVHSYRFSGRVFPRVQTTASIALIDKSTSMTSWNLFDVSSNLSITARRGPTGTGMRLLPYATRGSAYARRGISPGSQRIFVLSEPDRRRHGLRREDDVVPCVTTLRGLPSDVDRLTAASFEQHFVRTGRPCWLIKSREDLSPRLQSYLSGIPEKDRATSTCKKQRPWYRYEAPVIPPLLLHSAFTSGSPKLVLNDLNAVAVGAMYGVFGLTPVARQKLQARLSRKSVLKQIVPHSGRLRKIEVGQVNSLLSRL